LIRPALAPTLLTLAVCVASSDLTAQSTRSPIPAPTTAPASAIVPALDPLLARPTSELADAVNRYAADRSALFRRYDVQYSKSRSARAREFYSEWLTRLHQVDFRKLGQDARIDYLLLDSRLKYELELLRREDKEYAEMAAIMPFAPRLMELQETRRRMEPVAAPKIAEMLAKTAKEIDSLRKAIEKAAGAKGDSGKVVASDRRPGDSASAMGAAGARMDTAAPRPAVRDEFLRVIEPGTTRPDTTPGDTTKTNSRISKVVAQRAAEDLETLRRTLETWNRYYSGYDPAFSWWVADPYKRADSAMKAYVKVLREKVVGYKEGEDPPIIGDPIGAAGLKADLAVEMIPYTPQELVAIAEREFAWCEAEMKKAAREMGFGDDWKAAVEKVKTMYVDPGKQPDLIRDLAWEATDFVEKRGLVTVPPLAKEIWRMEMMTPEAQKRNPFFLGGEVIQVSFPTSTMEHEDKLMSMRGNNPYFSRATVFHELIPGHHLQGFMRDRYNTHRRPFSTPFWGEGWALYWEMLLWDEGFARTPEEKVGMLFWRTHRAARIIYSLQFHLGKMSPLEAVDFLVDRVGHERANATAEVRRSFDGSYSPLYQVAYMMGGLQLRALHAELVGSRKMTNRQFHDAILQGGSMPIEMVRASLTKQALTANHVPSWRFAGEVVR
jgi:uncharacterized protein (DUF885 family)